MLYVCYMLSSTDRIPHIVLNVSTRSFFNEHPRIFTSCSSNSKNIHFLFLATLNYKKFKNIPGSSNAKFVWIQAREEQLGFAAEENARGSVALLKVLSKGRLDWRYVGKRIELDVNRDWLLSRQRRERPVFSK